MKRFAVVLCAVLLVLSLCACDGKEAPAPPPESLSAPESPSSVEASEPEPEPEPAPAFADNWERMLDTYYYPYYTEETLPVGAIADPRGLLPEGAVIRPERLIETYSTGTSGKEECLALMDKLKAGQRLGELIESRGELYAIVTGPDGTEIGDALIRMDSLEVMAYGDFSMIGDSDPFRRDCILTDELKTQLEESGLDLSKTAMTFCIINNFSNGALFSDGEKECYLATSISHTNQRMVDMETGTMKLHPVTELPALMETCLRDMFLPNLPDESGNVYQSGGSEDVPLGLTEYGPVEDLCHYLMEHLTEDQYSFMGRTRRTNDWVAWLILPDTAPVEALLADYPGRMVPIQYFVEPYSKAQLDKAEEDMKAFLAEHPEIGHYPIRSFVNYVSVSLRQQSPLVEEFIQSYPVEGIYHLSVHPDSLPENPD